MKQKLYTKAEAIQIYHKAAKIFYDHLNYKDILIVSKKQKCLIYHEITFRLTNFLHFTGVKTKLSPARFFNNALEKRLGINDFDFKNPFINSKKLDVIQMAMEFPHNTKMIGIYNGPCIQLKADVGSGNEEYVLTFRFENKFDEHKLYPVGLNKEDIRKSSCPCSPIIAIYSKDHNLSLYDNLTYRSKNINIKNIHIPNEIKDMLTEEAYYQLKNIK